MTINTRGTMGASAATSALFRGAGSANGFETSKAAGDSVHDNAWTPYEAGRASGVVALLIDHRSASWIAIQRAIAMSDALDAKLHVVLAIPTGTAMQHPMLVASHVASLLETHVPRRGFELEVVKGRIEELGYERARDEDVLLVVVEARIRAKQACRLADDLGVPVLVARDARDAGNWIAASDMQHLKYPVLSAARELARTLERDVVYFHNARPMSVFVRDPMAGPGTYVGMLELQDDVAAAKRERLERLAASEPFAHSVVTRRGDTVSAVLDVVRDHDADMVVVGHHRQSWLGRLFGRSTAEQIVERTRRSALIVPLDGTQ